LPYRFKNRKDFLEMSKVVDDASPSGGAQADQERRFVENQRSFSVFRFPEKARQLPCVVLQKKNIKRGK